MMLCALTAQSWLQTLGVGWRRHPPRLCTVARPCLRYPRLFSKLVDNGFLQTSDGVFVSKSGLFFFFYVFSHSHPNLTSNFSLPISDPGSSVPRSLHLPSVSHSVLRIRP